VALVGFGFDAADFVGSTLIAYAVWAVAAVWVGYLAWPKIERKILQWLERRNYVGVLVFPAVAGLVLGGAVWWFHGILYGALVGLTVGALVQLSFLFLAIRKPATTGNLASTERMTDEEWLQLSLTPVTDATFRDQPVPLDGYAYDRCTFVRCTFIYKGEKPFSLRNFKVEDDWDVKGDSPQLFYFTALLTGLRFLSKDVEVAEELQPDAPIAYGEVRRPPKPSDSLEER